MPNSMTGFAAAATAVDGYQLSWEIRSVNNRFLDVTLRLPEDLKPMEATFREDVAGSLARGKVDCTLKLGAADDVVDGREIDEAAVKRLRSWQSDLEANWPGLAPMSASDLLRWPGVLKEPEFDVAAVAAAARQALAEALVTLLEARGREGARIASLLNQRLDSIQQLLREMAPKLASTAERHRDKLLERLERLEIRTQPERLEQEVALIAQRLDVSEEADRLEAHIAEAEDVLTRDEPLGRRLDFLIQELNREANTLASKVQDDDLTRAAVELKVLIEQMREQAQNLE